MRFPVSRRFFLGGISSFVVTGASADLAPATSLRPRARKGGGPGSGLRRPVGGPEALIAAAGLSGEVSFVVANARTGDKLERYRAGQGQSPASVAKTITTLYALDTLGPEHRFTTRLLHTGTLSNGILRGDLILAGGGDPTLDTVALADMAGQLKQAGVREVRGAFRVHDGVLPRVRSIDPTQPEHVGYNPAISGIALNFNRVHFEWKRTANGYAISMDARAKGYRPAVQMARMKVVRRSMPVYTYADRDGTDSWTVASGALGKGGTRWLPVRRPGDYAGDVFRTLARAQGIVLREARTMSRLPNKTSVLVRQSSPALGVILKEMLKFSNNLTAEMVGMAATLARGVRPANLAASAAEMNRWAAQTYGMSGTRMVDHSGLEDASQMTADDLVGALVQARERAILRPLLKPFKMRDAKGRVIKAHPIKVDAKTGTLNFVSGLGGFMTAADGTELVFAIFMSDSKTRARIDRSKGEVPAGARTWNRKAKKLQQKLIERWGLLYGS